MSFIIILSNASQEKDLCQFFFSVRVKKEMKNTEKDISLILSPNLKQIHSFVNKLKNIYDKFPICPHQSLALWRRKKIRNRFNQCMLLPDTL